VEDVLLRLLVGDGLNGLSWRQSSGESSESTTLSLLGNLTEKNDAEVRRVC